MTFSSVAGAGLVHPFTGGWTRGLFPPLGRGEEFCNETGVQVPGSLSSVLLRACPGVELLGSVVTVVSVLRNHFSCGSHQPGRTEKGVLGNIVPAVVSRASLMTQSSTPLMHLSPRSSWNVLVVRRVMR